MYFSVFVCFTFIKRITLKNDAVKYLMAWVNTLNALLDFKNSSMPCVMYSNVAEKANLKFSHHKK